MFRRFSITFAIFSLILDGLVVGFSLVIAFAIRPLFNSLPFTQKVDYPADPPTALSILFPIIWVGVLLIFSVYDGRKNLRVNEEFSSLTVGSILAVIAMAGILYLSYRQVSRVLFFYFCLQSYLLMIFWRIGARLFFRLKFAGLVKNRRVLILGAGEGGQRLFDLIQSQPGLGLQSIGYLDDDLEKQKENTLVLGPLERVRQVIAAEAVDDVVVALPRSAHERLNWVVSELHDLAVKVWIIPDYFSLALNRASVEEFAGIPMLDLRAPALSEYQRMIKRTFDLMVTAVSLPFLLLMGGVIALAIRLDSPGPIIYHARRVGENGKLFDMLKFRTMVQNADTLRHLAERTDENGNLIHKIPNDPRVTRVGRFLRKFSLDEMPQLINVVRGEMSLVGPRPEMPYLVDKYQPWQRKRFAVPQGLTGWWQIHGRSDKPMHLHTEEDLYYVQHYSIWLDLQILAQTIWVVLRGKGAY
jgi:exopolysaccharide biosynthesis polyprenyl glycosylphosphotransferase